MRHLVLTVETQQTTLSVPSSRHCTAYECDEYPLELVAEYAVDNEVNRTINGHQKVICLCQRMILMSKML